MEKSITSSTEKVLPKVLLFSSRKKYYSQRERFDNFLCVSALCWAFFIVLFVVSRCFISVIHQVSVETSSPIGEHEAHQLITRWAAQNMLQSLTSYWNFNLSLVAWKGYFHNCKKIVYSRDKTLTVNGIRIEKIKWELLSFSVFYSYNEKSSTFLHKKCRSYHGKSNTFTRKK